MRCKWLSRGMQSRDCLWGHGGCEGPGSASPLWQWMLLSPSPPPWDHSCSAGSKQGQRNSSCQALLSALSAFRPRSCCYLRTGIPMKKMSSSKPRGYGNSSDNINPKQQTPGACPQLCNPKANAAHLTEFQHISPPLGQ